MTSDHEGEEVPELSERGVSECRAVFAELAELHRELAALAPTGDPTSALWDLEHRTRDLATRAAVASGEVEAYLTAIHARDEKRRKSGNR